MDIDLSVLRSLESEKDISLETVIKAIEDALERDKFLSPLEAQEFGLIDEVVEARPNREEERGFHS